MRRIRMLALSAVISGVMFASSGVYAAEDCAAAEQEAAEAGTLDAIVDLVLANPQCAAQIAAAAAAVQAPEHAAAIAAAVAEVVPAAAADIAAAVAAEVPEAAADIIAAVAAAVPDAEEEIAVAVGCTGWRALEPDATARPGIRGGNRRNLCWGDAEEPLVENPAQDVPSES